MVRDPRHSVQKGINYGGHEPEWVLSGQQHKKQLRDTVDKQFYWGFQDNAVAKRAV